MHSQPIILEIPDKFKVAGLYKDRDQNTILKEAFTSKNNLNTIYLGKECNNFGDEILLVGYRVNYTTKKRIIIKEIPAIELDKKYKTLKSITDSLINIIVINIDGVLINEKISSENSNETFNFNDGPLPIDILQNLTEQLQIRVLLVTQSPHTAAVIKKLKQTFSARLQDNNRYDKVNSLFDNLLAIKNLSIETITNYFENLQKFLGVRNILFVSNSNKNFVLKKDMISADALIIPDQAGEFLKKIHRFITDSFIDLDKYKSQTSYQEINRKFNENLEEKKPDAQTVITEEKKIIQQTPLLPLKNNWLSELWDSQDSDDELSPPLKILKFEEGGELKFKN